MKKFILSITFLGLCIFAQAQTDNQYEGLELSKKLNLTQEQTAKIKELNKGIGRQFATIGKDRSLSGQEKGQKKRELALKHKQNILNVLTPEQHALWENQYDRKNEGIKNSLTDNLDDKLDILKDKYEKNKKAIEKNKSLSKTERKEMLNDLKTKYKAEKEQLKNEKDNIKNSVLLNE